MSHRPLKFTPPSRFPFNISIYFLPETPLNSYFREFRSRAGFSDAHCSTVTTLLTFFPPRREREMNIREIASRWEKTREPPKRGKGRFSSLGGKSRGGRRSRDSLSRKHAHWSRRITRLAVITRARALAKVGETYGTSFARPWLSRGRRITNWLSGWLVRAPGRDSLYGCVKPSVPATAMNQAPRFISSRVDVPRRPLPPPPPPHLSPPLRLFFPALSRNITRRVTDS